MLKMMPCAGNQNLPVMHIVKRRQFPQMRSGRVAWRSLGKQPGSRMGWVRQQQWQQQQRHEHSGEHKEGRRHGCCLANSLATGLGKVWGSSSAHAE